MADVMSNLNIETAGTEDEEAENIEVALGMEIEESGGGVVEEREVGDGT